MAEVTKMLHNVAQQLGSGLTNAHVAGWEPIPGFKRQIHAHGVEVGV